VGQARLADARLALDHHQQAVLLRPPGGVEDAGQLALAPDHRQLTGALGLGDDGRHRQRPGAERVVQVDRLRERRDAELAVEHPHALAVLRQSASAAAGGGV
jgi:hypothetical protein